MRGRRIPEDTRHRILHLRYSSRLTAQVVAQMTGVSEDAVYQIAPGRPGGSGVSEHTKRRIRVLRYRDGLSQGAVAIQLGVSSSTVGRIAPGRPGKVPNAGLRDAFLRSGLTASEVARHVGWWDRRNPDSSRVKRTLGLGPDINGQGCRSTRVMIDYETAERIADAIGIGVWEVVPDEQPYSEVA